MDIPVKFHVISDNFPIQACEILGNDFFEQTKAKIDYLKEYLEVLNTKIPFYPPEFIVVSVHSRALFFVRIGNSHVKKGYLPKITICDGVEIKRNGLVQNIDGKVYVDVINLLDTEIEIVIPIANLRPANLKDYEIDNGLENNKNV